MYRVQLTGNDYDDRRIGLHYQIHRSIGVHHAAALAAGRAVEADGKGVVESTSPRVIVAIEVEFEVEES